jgi:hypothetical protein
MIRFEGKIFGSYHGHHQKLIMDEKMYNYVPFANNSG